MEENQEKKGLSRREFIKAASVTAAGVMASSLITSKSFAAAVKAAPAAPRVIGANDRINVGFIGVGGMGGGHLNNFMNFAQEANINCVAMCDVWEKRRREAQGRSKCAENMVYSDYRKLLENKDIDAVVIATPDHWHAPIAIAAMEAGKHVYVEKPMTHTLEEAFQMKETALRTKMIVQVGSQGCTDEKWHVAGRLVKAGGIGNVLWAQGSYCRNNPDGEWNYFIDPEFTPDKVDWKMWLGNAPKIPFNPERYFRWRKYWDYGTGIIGDLWPHRLHPLMIAMALEEYPSEVACLGDNICHTDKGHGAERDVADTTVMTAKFPNGAMIFLAGATVNEQGLPDMIRGNKATIELGGGKVHVKPERPYADDIEERDEPVNGPGENHPDHEKNWLTCIRTNGVPNCNIELATRVQTMVTMAEKSYRQNKMMNFDPIKKKLI